MKRVLLLGPPSLAALALVVYLAQPWPVPLRWRNPETTSFMRYRLEEARRAGDTLEIRHQWVPLDAISDHVIRAVVLAEDARFREHRGVDWKAVAEEVHYDGEPPFSWMDPEDLRALFRAVRYYLDHREEVRGRSTITQQLAKNLYFTPERSLLRKISETIVAQRLEWFLSKDRILELYLNTVELGPGIFGVEAAAQAYFDRAASELDAFQAASLAGTLPHPLTSNPSHRPSRMAWRRDLILDRMTGRSNDPAPVPVAPEPDAPGTAGPVPAIPVVDPAPDGTPTPAGAVPEPDAMPADAGAPAEDSPGPTAAPLEPVSTPGTAGRPETDAAPEPDSALRADDAP